MHPMLLIKLTCSSKICQKVALVHISVHEAAFMSVICFYAFALEDL